MNSQAIVPVPTQPAAIERSTMSIPELVAQVKLIQEAMRAVMKSGEHYGVIPGTSGKPSLLKAGAEKLCLLFRMDPQYTHHVEKDGEHREIVSTCVLYHIQSGARLGSGMGSCSTRESKYAYRGGQRKCPKCGAEAIIKGKKEYGGGWLCFAKKGGCGAKFKDGDASIESQTTERVPNPDLADQWNTVLKMANKRSLVAAVLNATAASDCFTQDLEDLPEFADRIEQPADPEPKSAPRQDPPRQTVDVVGLLQSIEGATDMEVLILCKDEARQNWKRLSKEQRELVTGAINEAEARLAPAQPEEVA